MSTWKIAFWNMGNCPMDDEKPLGVHLMDIVTKRIGSILTTTINNIGL
jgi:hypothetical protein